VKALADGVAKRISYRRVGGPLGGFAGPKERRARLVDHRDLDAVRHAAGRRIGQLAQSTLVIRVSLKVTAS
jgi:hypothetical protein